MSAQRGDFVSPPASSPTDRRDADDATFAAELARLDGLEVADVAADVREQADALLSRTRAHMAWRGSRGGSLLSEDFAFLAGWDAARTAMFAALKPAPGTDTPDRGPMRGNPPFENSVRCVADDPEDCRKLGCDTPDQAVQRVLALAEDLDSHVKPRSFHPAGTHSDGASHAYADAAARIRATVAGPQRDHDEEGQ